MIYSEIAYPSTVSLPAKNLSGWAADLITTVPEALNSNYNLLTDYTSIYNSMYYILSSGGENSHFPRTDYIADVDGLVLFEMLQSIQMYSLEDYFEYYYTYNCKNRFYRMIGKSIYAFFSQSIIRKRQTDRI